MTDGKVNSLDFNALAQNFNKSEPAPIMGLGTLVPEPNLLGILAVSAVGVAWRRRRPV